MADGEELTPEEKLLRVIQKGDGPAPNNERSAADTALPSEAGDDSKVTALGSEKPAAGRGLVLLNRILGMAAILFLLLAGYETYLNIPVRATVYTPETLAFDERSFDGPIASISDTLDKFAERRIFGQVERPVVNPPGSTNTVNLLGWRAYARDNLSLMGMSDVKREQAGIEQVVREAIVMDKKQKEMHFLTAGKTLMLAEQKVTVSRVEEAAIELKRDDEILKIE